MRCTTAQKRILQRLDDRLSPCHLPELDSHLESCASCAAFFEEHRRLEEWLVVTPALDVNDRFENAFLAELGERLDDPGRQRRRIYPWVRPVAFFSAAAAGLIGLFVWTSAPRSRDAESPPTASRVLSRAENASSPKDSDSETSRSFGPDPSSETAHDLLSSSAPKEPTRQSSITERSEGTLSESPLTTRIQDRAPSAIVMETSKPKTIDPPSNLESDEAMRLEIQNALSFWADSEDAVWEKLEPLKVRGWPLEHFLAEIAKGHDVEDSAHAITLLGHMNTRSARRELLDVYSHLESHTRALERGLESSPSAFVDVFSDLLLMEDSFGHGLRGLIRLGNEASLEALSERLVDELRGDTHDLSVANRCEAMRALASWGPSATPCYLRFLEAGASLDFILKAIRTLHDMKPDHVENFLVIALLGAFEGVSPKTATSVVGPMGIDRAVESLQLITNPLEFERASGIESLHLDSLRTRAIEALGEIGTPAALRALAKTRLIVADTDDEYTWLDSILGAFDSGRISVSDILAILDESESVSWWTQLLSQSDSRLALEVLIELVARSESSPSTRILASEGIARRGDNSDCLYLVDMALSHPEWLEEVRGGMVGAAASTSLELISDHLRETLGESVEDGLSRLLRQAAENSRPGHSSRRKLGEALADHLIEDVPPQPMIEPLSFRSAFPRRNPPAARPITYRLLDRLDSR